jgi:protein phosphatase 1 regulatory subunit 7
VLVADRFPVWDDVTHEKLKTLSLSFRNVAAIANLESLSTMETLRLDNNRISKITGLSSLKELRWLDLSFNQIEVRVAVWGFVAGGGDAWLAQKIEGLDSLHKLTDLSLCNNRIASIEGLSGCTSLEFLSLANNLIPEVSQAQILRSLKKLRAFCMSGNPACKPESEYRCV